MYGVNFVKAIRLTDQDMLNSGSTDFLGRPVFSDIILKVKDKKVSIINAICTVEENFNIVKTSFSGRKGTVKEYISAEDYRVTINGSFQSEYPDLFPADEVRTLNRICNEGQQIEVISEYLAMFEIHYLVCEKKLDKQKTGGQNQHEFELAMLSDEDVKLIIEEGN